MIKRHMPELTGKKRFRIAVVGATGLVGLKMIQILEERNFPVSDLVPIASERSAGSHVHFQGRQLPVRPLSVDCFAGVQIALFSAGKRVSREWAPIAARQGTVVIDNSSAWRMDDNVPLVVPEINPAALQNHRGIIANPNCSTIQLVVVLQPLHLRFGIKRVVVSTYQSVSGSGKAAVQQLETEAQGGNCSEPVYPYPIAYNCLPHIDVFGEDGYTLEEQKMIRETRKIMDLPGLRLTATTVRVPVRTGHSESVNVEFEKLFGLDEVRKLLAKSPGVVIQDEPQQNLYPMPISAEESDEVFVGRLRRDESVESGLNMWIVSDNLRKGAATNAVQIAEELIRRSLLTFRIKPLEKQADAHG